MVLEKELSARLKPKILEMSNITLKELVSKGTQAYFSFYRNGVLYYEVYKEWLSSDIGYYVDKYQFPIAVESLDGASVFKKMKSIILMRWIRKALEEGTLVKVK